ncbi:Pimeloyl-ACP methyl ester carboxylesterase [Asanoa hainanensis]|uniref:Pimeloyl-ACP methyl ester carboxylesterase n=1 Tax=Asanoa hainanensis TaxID=560556 RepID=A0A239PDN1_9ACTN|nr:alpha/beta hydrolase [Asanoa hainanensis]SNT65025.1 Pimeloyl-ACP methyl ester carboxylesterase [Asanoa hainanensis]
MDIQHRRLAANDAVHHYAVVGTGPPLILLHGFPQTWRAWSRVAELLAGEFRIVMPDLRGLGGSPGPAGGYDKHSLAGDVRAIARAEFGTAAPATVCGHDLGGYVGFAYALSHRDATAALLLVEAAPPGTSQLDHQMTNPRSWQIAFHANADVAHLLIGGRERAYIDFVIRSRIFDAGAIDAAEVDRYAEAYSAPGALRAALEMYRSLALDRQLNLAALAEDGRLTMPVTAVGAAPAATEAGLREMVAEIATDGRAEVVPETGYWIAEEQPAALAEIIRNAARVRS